MRIIGQTVDGVIAEISEAELAQLVGLLKRGRVTNLNALPRVGDTFDIGVAWHRAERLTTIPDALLELRSLGTRIIEAVDSVGPAVDTALAEPPKEQP